jgi:hypothetical protein
MSGGVQSGVNHVQAKLFDVESTNQWDGYVVMKETTTFGKAFTKFCETNNKVVSDFMLTLPSGKIVSLEDTPKALQIEEHVTINYTLKVAYVHVTVPDKLEPYKLKIKLRHTFLQTMKKVCNLHKIKGEYKYTYQSGEDVLEHDSPITKEMGHNEHITIVCTKVRNPNFSTPIPKRRKTRSGREY